MTEHAESEIQIPDAPILEPIEGADKITTLVADADNTLWCWAEMHAQAMKVMAERLAFTTGIPYEKIQAAMKRVYKSAGTMDFSMLVQSMDIMQDYVTQHAETHLIPGDPDLTQRARNSHMMMEMSSLVETARKAYDTIKNKTFKLYPWIKEAMETVSKNRKRIIILTDAPSEKTIRRLKQFGLDGYIAQMFGQALPVPQFKEEPEYQEGEDRLRGIYDAIKIVVPRVDNHARRAMVSMGRYEVNFPVTILQTDERKPFINLSERLGMTPDEVSEQVAVLGDNPDKDIMLAIRNNCAGIYAGYGQIDEPTSDLLREFGTPDVVSRNLSAGNPRFHEIQQDPKAEITKLVSSKEISEGRMEALKRLIIDSRLRLARVDHPLQILDRLGIKTARQASLNF
jgi:FMN phosphatase YigB (HAD superfamily)